ncbi:MAG: hypothetical protein B7Y80_16615 [Hyphomicrobium sp. 32-62-53]|nr:MAG: hypothetical protein B7Z29_18655 [Hyphomicrobium sp. 12-62-95]OYX98215.1 MAG: hypothetical protein B7Y80_16615 [Hyphomicrobium sp. 32-62-53]
MHEPDVTKKDVKTRQGSTSQMNARVLGTSLAIIMLVFIGLYFGFWASDQTQTETAPPAPQTQTPTP